MPSYNKLTTKEVFTSHPVAALNLAWQRFYEYGLITVIKLALIQLAALLALIIVLFSLYQTPIIELISNLQQMPAQPPDDYFESSNWQAIVDSLATLKTAFAIVLAYALLIAWPLNIAINFVALKNQNSLSIRLKPALINGYKRLVPLLIATICSYIVIGAGLLLFIIPGIYFWLKLLLLKPIIISEPIDPFKAIVRSFYLTKNQLWNIIGVIAVMAAATLLVSSAETILLAINSHLVFTVAVVIVVQLTMLLVGFITNLGYFFRYHQADLSHQGKLNQPKDIDVTNYHAVIALMAVLILSLILAGVSS